MHAQIAQHLNIAESAILRIEEWANVLFVVCRKLGGRFVSKKVAKVEQKEVLSVVEMEKVGNRWQKNGNRVYFDATWIAKELGLSNSKARKISGSKLYYDLEDGQFYHNMPTTEGSEAIRHIQRLCTVTVTAVSTPEVAQRKCCNCGTWTTDVSQFSYFLAGSIETLCADCYDTVEGGL